MSSEGELLLGMFLFHFLLKVISQWSECVCLEFNLISPISGYAGHIINLLPPWQNIGYLLLWQTIKQNKKGETLTDMQIQTRSPFYVLSLPLIHPIITVSSFRHFSFTRSFFLTNAFLSVSPLFLFICLFTCVLPIVSSFAFSFTHCACLLFPIMLLGFVPMQHFISLIILFFNVWWRWTAAQAGRLRLLRGSYSSAQSGVNSSHWLLFRKGVCAGGMCSWIWTK